MRFSTGEISLLYLSIWVVSPPLQFGILYRILAVFFVLLYLFVSIAKSKQNKWKVPKTALYIIIYLVTTSIIIEFVVNDNTSFKWWIQTYLFFLFYFFHHVIVNSQHRIANLILNILLFLQAFWIARTIYGLQEYSGLSRFLTRSSEDAEILSNSGYGGFGLVYSAVLLIPIYFRVIKLMKFGVKFSLSPVQILNTKNLIVINFILTIFLVLNAGYMIALIGLVLYFSLEVIFTGSLFSKLSKLFILLLSIFVTLYSNVVEVLTEKIAYFNPNFGRKIHDISIYFSALNDGNLGNNTFYVRIERYLRSWDLFTDNIFFGVWSRDDIGKHSAIIDAFAQFGFLIGLLFVLILLYQIPRNLKCEYIDWKFVVFLAFIFGTNNIVGTQGVAVFVIIPLINKYFSYGEV